MSQYSRKALFSVLKLLLLAALQHGRVQLGLFKRLGQVILRAQADGFDDSAHFIGTGEHDHVERAVDLHQLLQSLNPIHLRHQHVQDNEIRAVAAANLFHRFLAARLTVSTSIPIHFQQRMQILPNAGFVVHDQNSFFFCI